MLWRSFPSDGISRLFISLNLTSASCLAPVLKITYWGCGALTIIAIVYLDTSHWSLVSLNRYISLYFDFSGNTEKACSLMASKLIFRAECRTKDSHGFNSHSTICHYFFSLPCNCLKMFSWLWSSLLMNTIDFHNNSNIWVSQWPYSLPNQVYWKQLLHVCQNWVKWRPF